MAKPPRQETTPKLRRPDRPDRPGPTGKTLLQLADERQLFAKAERRERQLAGAERNGRGDAHASLSPGAERLLEAALWTATLAAMHLTFDVLVMRQYGTAIHWPRICTNTARAWVVFLILFYPLHPHEANPDLLPGLPRRFQKPLRQAIFFLVSCIAGCFLIYVTNSKGYLYNMKRAPPLACLWLWAVVELELVWATLSLGVAAVFLWHGGYDIK